MLERIRHMLVKEFIQVMRDPRMRMVIFVIPCVQTLVIGYAVSTDVKHTPTAIYDLDNSLASRELAARQSPSAVLRERPGRFHGASGRSNARPGENSRRPRRRE